MNNHSGSHKDGVKSAFEPTKKNVILVLLDSMNRHMLSPYGLDSELAKELFAEQDLPPGLTENFDRFAARSWRFNKHFVGSLPCMPARREILAGFQEMLWRPWGPLEPFDQRLPELLADSGYSTGVVTDHYHYWEEAGNGYLQSFQSSELIRGHEIDNWQLPTPVDSTVPGWVQGVENWRSDGWARNYHGNVSKFVEETDFFASKVMRTAIKWLDHNKTRSPYFLHVESFDVHEPFHVPKSYRDRYASDGARDDFTTWPPYQNARELERFVADATDEEKDFVRSQYVAKLAMTDRWFGELIDYFDNERVWEDTVIIVTTDHGHDLLEHGSYGKQFPHFDTHAHIPMFVWDPEHPGNGRTVEQLTTTVDLFPSILDIAGLPAPEGTHGESFLPTLYSEDAPLSRDGVIYGRFGQGLGVTDGDWTLLKAPEKSGDLYYYSCNLYRPPGYTGEISNPEVGYFIPGVDLPQWRVPYQVEPRSLENFLFRRSQDPSQLNNLWDTEPDQRERLLALMSSLMNELGTPAEQYSRLGVPETI